MKNCKACGKILSKEKYDKMLEMGFVQMNKGNETWWFCDYDCLSRFVEEMI